jgi:hypothetical protein
MPRADAWRNCPASRILEGLWAGIPESSDRKITMIEQLSDLPPKTLGFKLSGKLHDEDYKTFVPAVDKAVAEQGKVRMLAVFHDFHGWDVKALWDDIKFSTTHCTKIERIALVGEKAWEAGMAQVCKPFTLAKIKYFSAGDMDAAWTWLGE